MIKMKVWVLLLVLSSVLCVSADGLYEMNSVSGCSDTDGEDVLILDNEVVWYADFNKHTGVDSLPAFADHPRCPLGMYEEAVANQQICRQNLKMARTAMKDFPKELDAPGSVTIYTTVNVEIGVQNTLICHVTGFYPAPVNVTWRKNTKKVVEGTSMTVPLSNKDGSFSQTSKLDFVPKGGDVYACNVEHVALTEPFTKIYDVVGVESILGPAIFCGVGLTVGVLGVAAGIYLFIRGRKSGEKISCMVEHSSLEKPLVTDWVPSMSESKKLMIVGAFGLILGLLFFLAGVIYMRMCSRDGNTPLAHKFSEKQPGDWSKDAADVLQTRL